MEHRRERRKPQAYSDSDNADRAFVEYVYAGIGREILAYLQYTIICDLPVDFFQRNVEFHLRERVQKIVSRPQVEEKLEAFWRHCCARDAVNKDWKEILHRGVDALPRLGKDKIAWVHARAYDLKEPGSSETIPRLLRSAFQTPSPRRVGSKRKSGFLQTPRSSKVRRTAIASPAPKVRPRSPLA